MSYRLPDRWIEIMLVLVAIGLSPALGKSADAPNSKLAVGDSAPTFALKTLNPDLCGTRMISSRTCFGASETTATSIKATVLSFGANSCKPCLRELPKLHELYLRLSERGLAVLVVIIDSDETEIEAMRTRVADAKLSFPVLTDRFTILAKRYGADELPFLLVVAPDGRIRWMRKGYGNTVLQDLEAVLEPLLSRETSTKVVN